MELNQASEEILKAVIFRCLFPLKTYREYKIKENGTKWSNQTEWILSMEFTYMISLHDYMKKYTHYKISTKQ